MSLLKLSSPTLGVFWLRVTRFSSPLTGSINSAQTKRGLQHFPIKASQQNMSLQVMFRSAQEYMDFQAYVRKHHVDIQGPQAYPEVDLSWPERMMINWSGLIMSFQAGDKRFNPTPVATINILLVDSLLSNKTFTSSLAKEFKDVFKGDVPYKNIVDDGLTPPTRPPGFIGPIFNEGGVNGNVPGPTRPSNGGGGTF